MKVLSELLGLIEVDLLEGLRNTWELLGLIEIDL